MGAQHDAQSELDLESMEEIAPRKDNDAGKDSNQHETGDAMGEAHDHFS